MVTSVAAGVLATVPMTGVMETGFRLLPADERYPLPPRQVTEAVDAGLGGPLPEAEGVRIASTLVAHLAYGGAAGSVFALAGPGDRIGGLARGIAFGLGVWAVSYLGLLPALGLLSPPTRHPRGRTALMVAAHVVWGASLALITRALERTQQRSR